MIPIPPDHADRPAEMWVAKNIRILLEVDGMVVHETTAIDEDGAGAVAVRPWIDLDTMKLHAIIGCTARSVRFTNHAPPVA